MDIKPGKTVVLITSGQPSLNPRLVKEADALADHGYQVTVIYAYWNDWGTGFDKELIPTKKWKAICVAGSPVDRPFAYGVSRLLFRVAKAFKYADLAISRPTLFLTREAKKHKADLYLAHNLGALKAAVAAAKKHNTKCGFDAEDLHRNETSDDPNNADVIFKTMVEDKYIPRLDHLTASSPQIAAAYQKFYPWSAPKVILNVFPKSSVKPTALEGGKTILRLFWFSQTIGSDRGIDDVVNALRLLNKDHFELNILGAISPAAKPFIDEMIIAGIDVKIHAPIHPDKIIPFASQYDVGLALENKTPYNRDICLTNKIFTYMQAGLAIIASDTTAQQAFITANPSIGKTYPKGNAATLATILQQYLEDKDALMNSRSASLSLAHERYNWEVESESFLKMVKETIADIKP